MDYIGLRIDLVLRRRNSVDDTRSLNYIAIMKGATMKTTLKFDRETKNTHVFKNEAEDAPIPSLYIKKSAFKDGPPESITVEIK